MVSAALLPRNTCSDDVIVARRTEELVSSLVKHITGGYVTTFTNQHGREFKINWEAPWRRIDMIPG